MDDISARRPPGPGSVRPGWFRFLFAAAVLAVVAPLAAACSGGPAGTAGSSGAGQGRLAAALAFARCMRSHGAPDYPDPNSSGVFLVNPSDSASFDAPRSTRLACAHLLPREGNPEQQARQQRMWLELAACMRQHGFPQFPAGWSGNIGQLISAGIHPGSAQLAAAFKTCGFGSGPGPA